MKYLFLPLTFLALFMFAATPLMALSPKEIIVKSDQVDDGETSISEMTMILIDKKNQKRVRKIKGFRKDYGEDSKNISFFMSPADVRNTAFLSFDYDDDAKEDDNWLFLPALRKVKRIASGNTKDSFMGSDFTYNDMNGLKIEEWDYQMVKKSDKVDGADCWVIGAMPKKAIAKQVISDTGYTKRVVWIRKDNFVAVKGKTWLKKGKKVKVMQVGGLKKIQGIWTNETLTMTTQDRKGRRIHATVLQFDNMKYNEGVKDSLFTTQRMEKGL